MFLIKRGGEETLSSLFLRSSTEKTDNLIDFFDLIEELSLFYRDTLDLVT